MEELIMKILTPDLKVEKNNKVELGDIVFADYGSHEDMYIAVEFTNSTYAWFSLKGTCANGVHASLEELTRVSKHFFTDAKYTVYKSSDYDLKLVPKEAK